MGTGQSSASVVCSTGTGPDRGATGGDEEEKYGQISWSLASLFKEEDAHNQIILIRL